MRLLLCLFCLSAASAFNLISADIEDAGGIVTDVVYTTISSTHHILQLYIETDPDTHGTIAVAYACGNGSGMCKIRFNAVTDTNTVAVRTQPYYVGNLAYYVLLLCIIGACIANIALNRRSRDKKEDLPTYTI